jgi:hypothetical protein
VPVRKTGSNHPAERLAKMNCQIFFIVTWLGGLTIQS